jgi:NAD(P)-dependent dehydrogenase (short-subunit alcohol dehydrogenase family)
MALATTKVALVTGAARGIGRAIALRLAHDGLDVAVNDITSSPELDGLVQEIKNKGRRSLAVPADISLETEVEKAVQKVAQDLGGLDVVRSLSWRLQLIRILTVFHTRWWQMRE